jgi:hypothetical protein
LEEILTGLDMLTGVGCQGVQGNAGEDLCECKAGRDPSRRTLRMTLGCGKCYPDEVATQRHDRRISINTELDEMLTALDLLSKS